MKFHVARDGTGLVITFNGKLDFRSNADFQAMLGEIARLGGNHVVFDLAGLIGIDSVGLGLLHIARQELDRLGADLCLASPQGAVLRLLKLTGAQTTFTIRP